MAREAEQILRRLRPNDRVIALDVGGEALDSLAFSRRMIERLESPQGEVVLVIAGSNGYAPSIRARMDERLSLSALTFPHQLTRIILLEQLFRAFKIARGEQYHK